MQKTLIGLLMIFLCSSFCVNIYYINEDGQEFSEFHSHGHSFSSLPIFYQSFNIDALENLIQKNNKLINQRSDEEVKFKLLADNSAAYIKLGKLDEAKDILLKLYNQKPEEYNINANLGTLYELEGNIDSALMLITKSLEIDSSSHKGSEWFHVKVLEAKKALQNDENWLKNNKVLNIKLPEFEGDSIINNDKTNKILRDIAYQLAERIPFSPKKDFLLANIFNEYGDLLSKVSVQVAYVAYKIGDEYDENNYYQMSKKAKKMRRIIRKADLLRVPKVSLYFPKSSKFAENPFEVEIGPRIHQDIMAERTSRAIKIAMIVVILIGIAVIWSIVWLTKRLLKRWRKANEG